MTRDNHKNEIKSFHIAKITSFRFASSKQLTKVYYDDMKVKFYSFAAHFGGTVQSQSSMMSFQTAKKIGLNFMKSYKETWIPSSTHLHWLAASLASCILDARSFLSLTTHWRCGGWTAFCLRFLNLFEYSSNSFNLKRWRKEKTHINVLLNEHHYWSIQTRLKKYYFLIHFISSPTAIRLLGHKANNISNNLYVQTDSA